MDMMELKQEIAYFMRRLYRQRLTTTSGGNISVRNGGSILITPSGIDKGRIMADQIGIVTMDGTPDPDNKFKMSIECGMHLEIYRRRPDVNAIVHAHPVTACSFAAAELPINTHLGSESYAILGEVAIADYALMGTDALAAVTGAAAEKANCLLMRNHGALAVGRTLLEAFDRLEVLENTAIINMNLLHLPPPQIRRLNAEQLLDIDRLMGRSGKRA